MARKTFRNDRYFRRDRFRQNFVEIGAILAIFRPFENFSKNFRSCFRTRSAFEVFSSCWPRSVRKNESGTSKSVCCPSFIVLGPLEAEKTPKKRKRTFFEKSRTLTGRLPLKHGSVWLETSGKRVSDDPQHFIFRKIFSEKYF